MLSQSQSQTFSCCYNPYCLFPFQRVFKSSQLTLEHKAHCYKWIITPEQRQQILKPTKEETKVKGIIESNMYSNPIKSLIDFESKKVAIRKNISDVYDQLQKQINSYLQVCKIENLRKLDQLEKSIQQFKDLILKGLRKMAQFPTSDLGRYLERLQWEINKDIHSFQHINMPLADILIMDESKLKEQLIKIRKVLSNFSETLVKEKRQIGHIETVSSKDMMKVISYLNEENVSFVTKFNKLCCWQENQFLTQSNLELLIKCPECSFEQKITKNKTTSSNHQLSLLSKHLVVEHLPLLGFCFHQRLQKTPKEEISFQEIVYLMKSQSFTELILIDGTNTRCQNLQINPQKLFINCTNIAPKQLESQCRWLYAANPEQAAFYTILLIYQIVIKLNKVLRTVSFKKQYLNLYSKIISSKNLDNFKVNEKLPLLKELKKLKKQI